MATFRKRLGPSGKTVWQAQIIRIGQRPKYRTFDTKGEADAWARQIEGAMDCGEWQDRTEGERTTLHDALERYEKDCHDNGRVGRVSLGTVIRGRTI